MNCEQTLQQHMTYLNALGDSLLESAQVLPLQKDRHKREIIECIYNGSKYYLTEGPEIPNVRDMIQKMHANYKRDKRLHFYKVQCERYEVEFVQLVYKICHTIEEFHELDLREHELKFVFENFFKPLKF